MAVVVEHCCILAAGSAADDAVDDKLKRKQTHKSQGSLVNVIQADRLATQPEFPKVYILERPDG